MLGGKLPRTHQFWIIAGVLAVFLAAGSLFAFRMSAPPERPSIAFSQFLQDLKAGQVSTVVADGDALAFQL